MVANSSKADDSLPERLSDTIKYASFPLWRFFKRHLQFLIGFTTVVMLSTALWNMYRNSNQKEIQLLVGPKGTAGADQAYRIEDKIRNKQSLFGSNYTIRRIYTDGFQENYRRVDADHKGSVLAFALDGLRDRRTSNVETLLPLDWIYLHCTFRKDFLKDCEIVLNQVSEPDTKWLRKRALSIKQVVSAIKKSVRETRNLSRVSEQAADDISEATRRVSKARFYLGPTYSGTSILASIVLEHAGLKALDVQATGIGDFEEMRLGLRHGRISGGFFIGPINSSLVQDIAKDGNCKLVSIDSTKGLSQSYPYLRSGVIRKDAYHQGDDAFCPADIETLATRRVLIVSPAMEVADAYYLAQITQEALQKNVANGIWTNRSPSTENADQFLYPLHKGAKLFRDNKPYDGWIGGTNTWWNAMLLAVLLSLAADILGGVNRRLAKSEPPTDDEAKSKEDQPRSPNGDNVRHAEPIGVVQSKEETDKTLNAPPLVGAISLPDSSHTSIVSRSYEAVRLELEINDLLKILELGKPEDESQFKTWREQTKTIGGRIYNLRRQDKLAPVEAEHLFKACGQLFMELDFLDPSAAQKEVPQDVDTSRIDSQTD